MAVFDSKIFNGEVFGKYVDRVPRVKQNKFLEAGILNTRNELKQSLADQAGGNYISLPMYGLIDGEPLNYDGSTNLTASSTKTFSQSMVVVGRMKAWVERDFSGDITSADFMDNVAAQLAEYWDDVDQATMLSILKGIFSMTACDFTRNHTYDISADADNKVGAATLNNALQRASGDNKAIFKVAIMHSAVSTNLENLQLISYLKYTDKNGIERDLGLGTWNGRLVLVDDSCPAVNVKVSDAVPGVYTVTLGGTVATGDTVTVDGQTFTVADTQTPTALATLVAAGTFANYTVTRSGAVLTFTEKVGGFGGKPVASITSAAGTVAVATTTEGVAEVYDTVYTTYVLGDGAFDFCDVGAKVPYEMNRDPEKNGGEETLYTRQRKVFAPRGISFTKAVMAKASPTAAELENGANWEVVNDGAAEKTFINHKAIPIARIISLG